jgi:LytS/YehU family sensor histidine kinase
LQDELDALEGYLYVEKVRFEDQFKVELEIAEAVRARRVPQFFLQPLVENAILEGIGVGPTPLRVVVSCRCLDRRLRVEVSRTAVGTGTAAPHDNGLKDLRRRLDLLYKEDGYGWTRSESADGMSLSIEIPLKT